MKKPTPHNDTPERLHAMQMAFAGHLRNPDEVPPPDGIEDRRMEIYRGLFFRNIRSFMSAAYPVLKSLYEDDDWDQLIREFFIEHRCQTPMFPELSREFLRYLQETRGEREGDFPFMLELAHYEWVERGVRIEATEIDSIEADQDGNLLDDSPLLSPLAWPLSYQYPVHKICDQFIPTEPPDEATHLLVYRRRDDKVKFMHINAVSRMLLDQMQSSQESGSAISGREMLRNIATAIGRADRDDLATVGEQLLEQWRGKDIVLGTQATREKNMTESYDNITARLRTSGDWVWPFALRLIMFYEFWTAGAKKLNGKNWFGNVEDKFPFPLNALGTDLNWVVATWGELVFSVMVLLGLFTRFAAFSLIVITFVAIATVHWPAEWNSLSELWKGYVISNDGAGNFRVPLLFAVILLPLVFYGGGKFSLDHLLLKVMGRDAFVQDRIGDLAAAGWAFLVLAIPFLLLVPMWGITLLVLALACFMLPALVK